MGFDLICNDICKEKADGHATIRGRFDVAYATPQINIKVYVSEQPDQAEWNPSGEQAICYCRAIEAAVRRYPFRELAKARTENDPSVVREHFGDQKSPIGEPAGRQGLQRCGVVKGYVLVKGEPVGIVLRICRIGDGPQSDHDYHENCDGRNPDAYSDALPG